MTIDELLNQPARYLKASGNLFCDARNLNWVVNQNWMHIGVKTQEEKELLDGYMIVLGKTRNVFIHPDYCYRGEYYIDPLPTRTEYIAKISM